jgi:hypothetical protein
MSATSQSVPTWTVNALTQANQSNPATPVASGITPPVRPRPDFGAILPSHQQCAGTLSNVNEYVSLRICADMIGEASTPAFCQSSYLTKPYFAASTALIYAFGCALSISMLRLLRLLSQQLLTLCLVTRLQGKPVRICCQTLCRATTPTSMLPISEKSLQGTALICLTSIESIIPKRIYVMMARLRCKSIMTSL